MAGPILARAGAMLLQNLSSFGGLLGSGGGGRGAGFGVDMTISTVGLERIQRGMKRMGNLPASVRREAVKRAGVILLREWRGAVTGVGSGTKLGVRTGDFRRRIRMGRVTADRVTVGTDHPAAAIHEYGGIIRPRRAEYLVFAPDPSRPKDLVSVKEVRMPRRPHRSQGIAKAAPLITKEFSRYIRRELDRSFGRS